MSLLNFLKNKELPAVITFPATLGAPAEGTFVSMEHIPDEMFSGGVLGDCCGVDPVVGNVYAPIDGKISHLAATLHAVGIDAGGMALLLHVGVDTVEMEGDGFCAVIKVGQCVKRGDLLLTMDLEKIKAAGHPATVIMALTNSDEFGTVESIAFDSVKPGDDILRVNK